ncbi:alpha/beta hydrolase [Streptomyces radicis]|uniref:Alpha/beta hydrolase n=1 Tax=Streptomyces radicis TaxID=1750517 RepID=A0A3A9WMP7_9ACTN|nr:alpha/beta hydrolase [Streptomyces radicis]RKN09016.1 alpha/beta hydrolase [Streptomyces radicis]RKN22793.1 alpha/beta hydrolase [Streptomyces radicis]
MRRGGTRAAALAVAMAVTVGACSGDGAPPAALGIPEADAAPGPEQAHEPALPAEFTEQTLTWAECPAPSALQGAGEAPGDGWECARLSVPLDYADPEGSETIDIAVIRARSTAEGDRVGSLVFNFGGPGGSGVATLPRAATRYEALRAGGFDLVSFDPRGVGESAGVVCRSDAEIDAAGQQDDGPPLTPDEESAYLADSRDYARDCAANAGRLLPHVTTRDAARDLDLLRAALGDEKLHYFGVSYGTKLGAVYAHLFPERVGRAVFDAVVDPTRDVTQRALLQAEGFQLALDNYLADCAATGPDCPTGDGGRPAYDTINGLFDALRARPLPTATERELTAGLALTALLSALYSEASWPYLTEALRQALDEDRGDLLLAAAEEYNGRDAQGRYRNLHAANNAINCADFASRLTVDDVAEHRAEFEAASPVFGPQLVWSVLACAHWPVSGESDRPEVSAEGAAPILLLATTGDPATPYAGAERMREALGDGVGVLLTYDGEGHGAYGSGDPCVTAVTDRYLLDGTVPEPGLTCGG